jgi:DNA repair exonuclease SbcCD ATPase subunit
MIGVFSLSMLATACAPARGSRQVALEDSHQVVSVALEAPAQNLRALEELTQGQADLKEATAAMEGWPKQEVALSGEPLAELYQEAERDGRSRAVVEVMRRNQAVRAFMEDHQEDLNRRVHGGVAARLKKDGCACEVNAYGTVNYALREEAQRRLVQDMRAYSRAHNHLEEADLGRREAAGVQERLDTVLRQSFFVHVRAPTLYQELERAAEDMDELEETLAGEERRLQQASQDPALKRGDQKALQQRQEATAQSLAALREQRERLKALQQEAQSQQEDAQRRWQQAFEALLEETQAQAAQ